MRPVTISLDATTWELAKKKSNFSSWVRDQLRSEDNKRKEADQRTTYWCKQCLGRPRKRDHAYCIDCQIDMGLVDL